MISFILQGRARSGIVQAPCGWGKTFTGVDIIARNNVTTLVMVHTKLLFRQWIEELGKTSSNVKIGKVGDGLLDIQDITVGIYIKVYIIILVVCVIPFLILVDEAHLCPAELFSTALNNLSAKVKLE